MRSKNSFLLLSVSAIGLTLAACGGSSTPPPAAVAPPPPPPSAEQPGLVSGPISGFGSVIVNGKRYGTDNATFIIDGAAGTQADLKVGQIVRMKTTTNAQGEHEASEVVFEDLVQGPIESINLNNNRMVVLGQTVVIRASTSFDEDIMPASLEGLTVGEIVEVSGHFNGSGSIIASQVELKDAGSSFEITGHVSALNSGAGTFKIRGQDIDFSGATLEDFNGAEIANGNLVEAKGDTITPGGVLIALTVELEEKENQGDEDDEAEIHGFITEFTSSEAFVVGDTSVITNGSTVFENCLASDLAVDVEVEVEGTFNAEGAIVADKVECEIEADLKIESTLDSVDAPGGTLTVFGVTFHTDMSTRFQDKTDPPVTNFGLDDLTAEQWVSVKGYERSDGTYYAKKVERDEPEDEHEVQGPVETVGADSLVILGINIETTPDTEYEDVDDTVLTEGEFFGSVMVDDLVEVEGAKTSDDTLTAEELSFEDPDD